MIDKNKIPEKTLEDLVELLGYDEAEAFLNDERYNFLAVQQKIFSERLKRKYGKRIFIYLGLSALVIAVVYEILSANCII